MVEQWEEFFQNALLLVESQHASCDGHVHGYLCRHSTNEHHLLPSVWVESAIVYVLCPPNLFN